MANPFFSRNPALKWTALRDTPIYGKRTHRRRNPALKWTALRDPLKGMKKVLRRNPALKWTALRAHFDMAIKKSIRRNPALKWTALRESQTHVLHTCITSQSCLEMDCPAGIKIQKHET